MANVDRDNPEKTRRMAQAVSSGRSVICSVLLLDGTTYDIDVDKKAVGLVLFDKVCDHLDLLEKDYFGLNYIDVKTNLTSWLNLDKKISKQMKDQAWHFNFEVKFYPTDVHQLHEDLTRYQLCLQIRRDIVSGTLPCSFVTYSLLGSYTVQSELGDWEMEEFGPGIDYIKNMKFAPNQDRDLLKKIVELHKTHKGQTPEEAELHFLDNAKKLALYGIHLHDAKDHEGVDIQLGICAGGIYIYKDKVQINRFVWPKVIKMSYRRNKFYIKLRPGEFEDFQSMIAFKLLSIRHAKRLWKISVEHHSFFRFKEAEMPRKRGLLKLGSKFRYSGRTLYQSKMAVTAVDRPMPNFDRIHSKRATYGGRPSKKHEVDDYYSRPIREPKPSSRPPKPEVVNDNFIDRRHEDEPPPARNVPQHEDEDEDEDPIEKKHRMEKMHGIATPLAVVTPNKDRDQLEHNNGQPGHMEESDDDRHEMRHRGRHDDERRYHDEDMVRYKERPIDIPVNHAPPHLEPAPDTPFKLLSKEEQKRQHKEEKERIKRAKEEEKRRKKEEEKERKRIEKERKSKKGKEKIGQEWNEAVTTAVKTEVILPPQEESPVTPKRLSSFEEQKERLRQQIVSSLQEGRLSEGDPSDKETEAADDNADVSSENEEVNRARVGEEFDL